MIEWHASSESPAIMASCLRVAVLASNAAEQHRLATLVEQCGHQLVELAASPGLTVRATTAQTRDFDALPEEPPVLLTPREIEVLAALGNGLTNKETARLLGISPHTVKFHIESLFRKLGVTSRAKAVARGMQQQIVEF